MLNDPNTDRKKRRSCLIVDDTLFFRFALARLMERLGYQCVTSVSATLALRILKGAAFHVIVTDLEMPVLSGICFIEQIKSSDNQKQTRTPIIAVSGTSCQSTIRSALDAGANAFLEKPVGLRELDDTLTNVIAHELQN